jgi:hypothetical protein
MKKDVKTTISYWRDPGDGSLPDPEHDAEIFLGHWDEENRTMLVRDIRGAESDFSLDTHGFEAHTLAKKDRKLGQTYELHGSGPPNPEIGDSEYFEEISDMIKKVYARPSSYFLLILTCT